MYLISQFSKISGLTVKALRYYDEQNILKPTYRDQDTMYRVYGENDLKKAQLIKLLRSLNFSISEMKEALQMAEDENDLSYILREKIEHIKANISSEKALIQQINSCLSPTAPVADAQHYEISISHIPATLVASIRFSDSFNQMGTYVSTLYKAAKNSVNSPMINCYFDGEYAEPADMELCLPVKKQISDSSVVCKHLPAVSAISTTHHGSYDTLHNAYKALFQYVNEQNLSLLLPTREIYIKSPGMMFKGNPQSYVTQILLPFQEK